MTRFDDFGNELCSRKGRQEWLDKFAVEKGYVNYEHYKEHVAREMGFKNWQDYRADLIRQKLNNQNLEDRDYREVLPQGDRKKLNEKGRGRDWIIWQLNTNPAKISSFLRGKIAPPDEIYNLLDVKSEDLDKIEIQ